MSIGPYDKIDELQADRAGVYLVYKAGYNPEVGLDFFYKLHKQVSEGWISSHPTNINRFNCLGYYLYEGRRNARLDNNRERSVQNSDRDRSKEQERTQKSKDRYGR